MHNQTSLGMNRTGAQMSPLDASRMEDFAESHSPELEDEMMAHEGIANLRADYGHEAEAVGTVPIPGTLTGAVTTGMAKLTGKKPEVLVDKLGERLAFERTGVRLYEALMDKLAAADGELKLPFSMDDLQHHHDEELEHMEWCAAALESIGADPSAQTPCADTVAVASGGIMQVLTDPRTTMAQCLNAMLTAELTDTASWELLIDLARESGQDNLAPQFEEALRHEKEHTQRVRKWLSRMVLDEAA
ncbi:MAG TPA: ferritin-like domain-containing protein [Rhodocyclaceae bacterium]|nr:ferritin-like domain-containing protein [Rhodocyclaceae bacterium]